MMSFDPLLEKLLVGCDLSPQEMTDAVSSIMAGQWTQAQTAAFLVALSGKKETATEITAAAQVMRRYAMTVETGYNDLVDTCGTGGDGKSTFNISTASAIVAACLGVRIAKHGNRSVSSRSGSADFLEQAGVKIDLDANQVARCIKKIGIGFLFAPMFHSAMKHVAPARKAIGIRSIFNLLGPLTNPAGATRQVIGVFDEKWLKPMAQAAQTLGINRVMTVHAKDGLDEISTGAATQVVELRDGVFREYCIEPTNLGLDVSPIKTLAVTNASDSLSIVERVFAGESGPASDIVAANAAAAVYVADRVGSLREGVDAAREVLQSGAATHKLKEWCNFSHRV